MERKLTILAPFFENPLRQFSLRELSRVLKINHTTVRQHLGLLAKEGILSLHKMGIYSFYQLVLTKTAQHLKLFYNLEKLSKSGLIEDLERAYDLPVIVLFGSYASAMDDATSDIDLCIITDIQKDFPVEKYERLLNRKVSIHKFSGILWKKAIKANPGLVNSICNGIVLSGELVVV